MSRQRLRRSLAVWLLLLLAPLALPAQDATEALANVARHADDLCIIRSMHTNAINHDPAITFLLTGTEQSGRPSMGAWISYGLGSENQDLPAFVAMISRGTGRPNGQPLYERL